MKYCTHCGKELQEDATFCSQCGSYAGIYEAKTAKQESAKSLSGLKAATKIVLIISMIMVGISTYGLVFIWAAPMTSHYCKKIDRGEPVSMGFKVCTLLFVSTPAGIMMLCDQD